METPKRTKIANIFDPALLNTTVCVKGWVRTRRGNKNVQFIRDMMEKRQPKYEAAADLVIHTDGKSADEICKEIRTKEIREIQVEENQ